MTATATLASMVRILLALLAVALLAGCAGQAPAAAPDPGLTAGDCDDADCPAGPGLTADSSVPAPAWSVGQWWEWEPEDASGVGASFRSVVLSAGSGAAVVGTDSPDRAKQAAAFDHLLIGEVGADLEVAAWGDPWSLVAFPLTNGKTWTATLPNIAWDVYLPDETVEVAMRADFDEALQGFRLMGHVDDDMVVEATYLPATGWYGELVVYDVDPEQDPLEFRYRAKSTGLNFTGPAYTATAEALLVLADGSGLDAPPPEGQPFVQPQPHGQFTMGDGGLYGLLLANSVVGTRAITLTDPQGQQRQVVSAAHLEEDEQLLWLDEPGVAGQWTVATTGAGGFSLAYVELYEIALTETVL